MSKKNLTISFLLSLVFTFCFETSAKTIYKNDQYSFAQNEKFVIRALLLIQSAQSTYQATSGKGNFGSLNDLQQAEFIDSVLATGDKYGYHFTVFKTNFSATMPAKFYVTSIPRRYRKTGRKSFYIDESGELHGADKSGEEATVADTIIDTCFSGNESCTIENLRTLHRAQITYQTSVGNGNFGTLNQLYTAGLINQSLASGFNHGYNFTITTINATPNSPAFFKISAVPQNYGITGIMSFYTALDGILRGADKNGASADDNDPPI